MSGAFFIIVGTDLMHKRERKCQKFDGKSGSILHQERSKRLFL